MDYRRTRPEFRETVEFLNAYDDGETPEYQVHRIGNKYAIVLAGMPAEIVGCHDTVDNGLKIAQALNEAEGL